MTTRDRVRFPAGSRRWRVLAALAAAIAIAGGAALFALPARADQPSFACAPTPQPAQSSSGTDSASPSAGPTALCVSVLANQSSITSGGTVQYAVSVWTQGPGTLPGVGLWLTTDASGVGATFTSCPSGTGTSSCVIGLLGTPGGATSPYQMEAQVQVPSSTSVSSLTMFAMASASTTPSMGSYPQAGQPVTVTAPSPSASPSSSASPSASSSSGAAASSSAAAGQSSNPASAATKPASGVPALPTSAPVSVGTPYTFPAGTVPVQPAISSSTTTDSGQFPVIAPGPYVSTSSTPLANTEPLPGSNTGSGIADPNRFTLNLGMSANTAMALALVALALAIVFAATRFGRVRARRPSAAAASGGAAAPGGAGASGASGGATQVLRRRRSGVSRWLPGGSRPERRRSGPVPPLFPSESLPPADKNLSSSDLPSGSDLPPASDLPSGTDLTS